MRKAKVGSRVPGGCITTPTAKRPPDRLQGDGYVFMQAFAPDGTKLRKALAVGEFISS